MSIELASKAWDSMKPEGEPEFAASQPDHRQNLIDRAEGVVRTGVTVNRFEEKVKELHEKEKKESAKDAGPLGTTNAIGEAAPLGTTPTAAEKAADKVAADKADKAATDKAAADKVAAKAAEAAKAPAFSSFAKAATESSKGKIGGK